MAAFIGDEGGIFPPYSPGELLEVNRDMLDAPINFWKSHFAFPSSHILYASLRLYSARFCMEV